jgi:hypothetical protein
MKCECCDNVAVEHVAIREGGKIREVHLCDACADADPGIAETRQRARQNRPPLRATNVHDFIRHWEAQRRSLGRELSKAELIELLDRLCD